jgi:hypothetical protein
MATLIAQACPASLQACSHPAQVKATAAQGGDWNWNGKKIMLLPTMGGLWRIRSISSFKDTHGSWCGLSRMRTQEAWNPTQTDTEHGEESTDKGSLTQEALAPCQLPELVPLCPQHVGSERLHHSETNACSARPRRDRECDIRPVRTTLALP